MNEDKIAEAINRLEMTLRALLMGILVCVLWIALCAMCAVLSATPLLTAAPDPPALQYWYTVDIPMDGGVYPLEVYAPVLPPLIHQPVIVEIGEPPAPPVDVPEPGTWLSGIPILGMVFLNLLLLRSSSKISTLREALRHICKLGDEESRQIARKALER